MYTRISAEFDNSYTADRAYARIKSNGIACAGVKTFKRSAAPEPGLFITQPYPRQNYSYYNNQAFGLPETTGTSIRMDTSLLENFGGAYGRDESVRLEVTIDRDRIPAVKGLLINNGGRNIRH